MRPRQTDNTNPVRPPMFPLLFFSGYDPIFFAIFFFAHRGSGRSIFSRVLIRALVRRELARCFIYGTTPSRFFVTFRCFPCVFKAKNYQKFSTKGFLAFEDLLIYIYIYTYVKIFAANKYIKHVLQMFMAYLA